VGFENVKFFRPGYAIEYDYFPTQLKHTLKQLVRIVFAGQINGTTGYEEAASRINGWYKCKVKAREGTFNFKRDEAYWSLN
jgi:tRNA uridine 5-carboxymethylaminomethyl modification enzyme